MNIILKNGRGGSNGCEINNVVEDNNIVIGDNHRFAPYFWANMVGSNKQYKLIHIDHHYDDNVAKLNETVHSIPDPTKITFTQYISKKLNTVDDCAVTYDNIISYFSKYNDNYKELLINSEAVNKDSDLNFTKINSSMLANYLESFSDSYNLTILDIDFDYFANNDWILEDKEIKEIFEAIRFNLSNFNLITFALSPSTTKENWNKVDEILEILNKFFSKQYSF